MSGFESRRTLQNSEAHIFSCVTVLVDSIAPVGKGGGPLRGTVNSFKSFPICNSMSNLRISDSSVMTCKVHRDSEINETPHYVGLYLIGIGVRKNNT